MAAHDTVTKIRSTGITPAPDSAPGPAEVDILVVGSGTGLAAALSAHEAGSSVLVIEKTAVIGGSTARSGGAFWIPGNHVLAAKGAETSHDSAARYLAAVVGDDAPAQRWNNFLAYGPEALAMLQRTTPMKFTWAKGYSDYHPEKPGGSAVGRSCECRPFDLRRLGPHRAKLRGGIMEAPLPMPVTGGDYKWLNLLTKVPTKGFKLAVLRAIQGIGGAILGREYAAGGQALAAGLYAGVLRAGIPVWTETSLVRLLTNQGRVTGAIVSSGGHEYTVQARHGVILAAGGFDHDLEMRRQEQTATLGPWSLGADGNTGDAIAAAKSCGATTSLLDQAWWFPAIAPIGDGAPSVLLAERSLPGSFMVDSTGRRFTNEAQDYMSFGQRVLEREKQGRPVGQMWLIFDQEYRNSYLLAGTVFPGMKLPASWYRNGIAVRGSSWANLAHAMSVPEEALQATGTRFNHAAALGIDDDFGRGNSAYDRYYGDPTMTPNPNLRPLNQRKLFAVKVVLSDLGTCGGITADESGRALDSDAKPIPGLYAIGNTAANAFGKSYPGAGATIGQGLVFGHIAAQHAVHSR
ncbi:3-ketosteroid-delta-1-dehydrogenase [Pseudarthrobacter sp. NPDC092184]|uniref:3-ketosteroid-delta-1-dehydrogenase n=1 Tax=unclassified Pseudarthrobacter TaxID=2647000 RepID=UPI0037F6FB70